MNEKNNKVLVAMSGGVDSSVAAALLLEQGYDVTGAYMINYQAGEGVTSAEEKCWVPDYRDAMRVAAKLGIALIKLDFRKEYKKMVLDYMFEEYEKGRTPNPDVLCNKFIKFGVWLDRALELGYDKLATGHYARLRQDETGNWKLEVGADLEKDQTYFLHQLNQEQLKHTLFPLGDLTKKEVRNIAKKLYLPVADKEESMGICFVGEVSMKDFLQQKIKPKPGRIVTSDGEEVGEHQGLPFYTIGQRHIGVESRKLKVESGDNKPLYVVEKRFETNELVVGEENDPLLRKEEIEVEDVNWISGFIHRSLGEGGQKPDFPLKCKVRLRHRQPLQNCELQPQDDKSILVKFKKPQRAVTQGQFAVFYLNNECLGGGVIK